MKTNPFALTRCRGDGRPQRSLSDVTCTCGGVFRLHGLRYDPTAVDRSRKDLLRYHHALPLGPNADVLGTGFTPTTKARVAGRDVWLKEEQQNPTGSFKDRGMCVLANLARDAGRPVFVDSVGNTAAALAMFAERFGLEAHVFAPASTSEGRAEPFLKHGARLHRVLGPRSESGKVALATAERALYMSHIYQPLFQAGTATCAFEIAEQVSPLPDRIFLAVGQGTLFLGLHHGFRALEAAGVIDRLPALFAVRPETPTRTLAVGAAALHPLRATETRHAARTTGGVVLTASEASLRAAHVALVDAGHTVDPAAAMATAGWLTWADEHGEANDLVVLCGAAREPFPEASA